MTFVYIVRCRFTEPAKEQAWNDWYSGPKIVQMLNQPHFRTCQRFRRAAGEGRDYLALWTVATPEALSSRSYVAQWGFAEWSPCITDWSRDLFDARHAPEGAFEVTPGGALQVVSFDGASADQAAAGRDHVAQSQRELIWLPVVGLDRHTPLIGLSSLVREMPHAPLSGAQTGPMQAAIYRPISDLHRARAA
jgi:hypothetical protein